MVVGYGRSRKQINLNVRMFREEIFKVNLRELVMNINLGGKATTRNAIGCSRCQILSKQWKYVDSDGLAMLWEWTKTTPLEKHCWRGILVRASKEGQEQDSLTIQKRTYGAIGVRGWRWRRLEDGSKESYGTLRTVTLWRWRRLWWWVWRTLMNSTTWILRVLLIINAYLMAVAARA